MRIAKIVVCKVLNFFKKFMSHVVKLYQLTASACISFVDSIETISKKAVWIISFFIFLSAIFLAISSAWQKTVYVYPTNLPEKAIKSGLSSENLTESIIRNIQKLTSLEESNDSNYLNQLKIKNNLGFESGNCLTPFSPEKYAMDTSRVINFHIQKKPQNIEVKLSETAFSIGELGEYLKRIFNRSSIVLKPSIIWSEADSSYLVQVSARYNSNFSHNSELTAKNLNQAEDSLTLLILKYINPAIYASIMFETYPLDALEGISLATDHLQEYKEISSPSTLKGYLYLGSTKESERLINLIKAESYFEEAIKKNKFDFEAKIGLLFVEGNLLRRTDNSDYSKSYKKAKYDQAVAIADDLILKKKYLAEAYTLKALLNDITDRKKERLKVLKAGLNELPKNPLLQSAYITYLLDSKYLNEAEEYLKTIDYKSDDPYYPTLELVNLRLLLEKSEFIKMQLISTSVSDCVVSYLPQFLYERYINETDPLKKKQLQRIIPTYFGEADRSGVKSLVFYGIWANFLSSINHYDEALSKYKKSLEYPGEHRWTWLNMASILNKQKKYKEAEAHAKESLSLGVTGAGISNYLEAIFWQKDYQRFLTEYKSWKIPISVSHDLNMRFLVLHGFAECYLGNMDEAKSVLEEIDLNEKMYNEFHTQEEINNELYRADLKTLKSCIYK